MERHEILEMMGALQLSGMRAAYDEIVSTGMKRQQGFERVIGALLKAEIAEKQARSIRYQMGSAKLPLAKELADVAFDGTPINQQLVHDLAGGAFLDSQRNVILIGGTGTGKSHIAIAIARNCIRAGRNASSTSSTSSTSSRLRSRPVGRAASPMALPAFISSSSTNSATCRSHKPAASCSSTSSAGSTSAPRSSSPPTWPSANGPRCLPTPR
jgi:hypothetical protein